jgi:hypothetical protein
MDKHDRLKFRYLKKIRNNLQGFPQCIWRVHYHMEFLLQFGVGDFMEAQHKVPWLYVGKALSYSAIQNMKKSKVDLGFPTGEVYLLSFFKTML